VIVEALQSAEDKMKAQGEERARAAVVERREELLNDATAPVAGNPKGDVTVVEFFDYRCPYCKQVEPSLEKLVAEDRQLRLVYKEFPVLGPESDVAAHVALAARKQGKYDIFHRAMMAVPGHFDEAAIYKVAATVGLDIDRLKQDAKSPEVAAQLKANSTLGNDLRVDGTPAFIVGDTIVPGAISLDALKEMIATARGKP
jgi:protein-disulfide isomerase